MNCYCVLIIGDVILDYYNDGKISGYEQNSTAHIFICDKQYICLGGAGNVAANVSTANMNAYIASIINSKYKETAKNLFNQVNVSTDFTIFSTEFPTSIKYRYCEKDDVVFRADEEKLVQVDTHDRLRELFIEMIFKNIFKFNCIIISDYAKGLLTEANIEKIIKLANQQHIPIIIDPSKKRSISSYLGATIIKLNKNELQYFTNKELSNEKDLMICAQELLETSQCQIVIVTCAEEGILYYDEKGVFVFHHNRKMQSAHVIGAGDTITAYTAYCLLNKLDLNSFMKVLSVAGELAVKESRTSHINIKNVYSVLLERA